MLECRGVAKLFGEFALSRMHTSRSLQNSAFFNRAFADERYVLQWLRSCPTPALLRYRSYGVDSQKRMFQMSAGSTIRILRQRVPFMRLLTRNCQAFAADILVKQTV
jgi:hypothetical protein